jgi:molybdopterin/thiamine biosynthesis adenylyltransferase
VVIGTTPNGAGDFDIHPAGLVLGACYAVGAVLKKALRLPYPSPDTLQINLRELVGDDLPKLYELVSFDEAHLAGAGAIGNGFLYGLSQFQVRGTLHICDDDTVSDGNLQRCVFFTQGDVNAPKADRLCHAAREYLPTVRMIPHNSRLQDLSGRTGAWLKRLIVGVDSPRARRKLQSEIPGAVFDASTTGVSEVVFHYHKQPTNHACLSCIYHENPEEHAHEKHIAEALGLSVETIKQERISEVAAAMICKRYCQLTPANIVGSAFDTLFKQLCSTEQLKSVEGRQVLAPFAFVSVLGGVLLAIEFIRRVRGNHTDLFNDWRVSPWANPVMRRQRKRERHPNCEFCGDPVLADIARKLWS